jgi:hypothetical protein
MAGFSAQRGAMGERTFHAEGGAPPLDWHVDAPEPGIIVLGEPPDEDTDDPIALAVKIVDCMCPREVCTVCGVPRERVTGEASYIPDKTHTTAARRFDAVPPKARTIGRVRGRTRAWFAKPKPSAGPTAATTAGAAVGCSTPTTTPPSKRRAQSWTATTSRR